MKVKLGKDYSLEIVAGKDNIQVRRLFAGVVVDRYNTLELRLLPNKRVAEWMEQAYPYIAQHRMYVEIDQPRIPEIQPNVFDRLEAAEARIQVMLDDISELSGDLEIAERKLTYARQAQNAESVVDKGHDAAIATAENSERLENTPSRAPLYACGTTEGRRDVAPTTSLNSVEVSQECRTRKEISGCKDTNDGALDNNSVAVLPASETTPSNGVSSLHPQAPLTPLWDENMFPSEY